MLYRLWMLLLFIVGMFVGALTHSRAAARASAPAAVQYRVLETTKQTTMEKEMNEHAANGCRLVLHSFIVHIGYGFAAVMECSTSP